MQRCIERAVSWKAASQLRQSRSRKGQDVSGFGPGDSGQPGRVFGPGRVEMAGEAPRQRGVEQRLLDALAGCTGAATCRGVSGSGECGTEAAGVRGRSLEGQRAWRGDFGQLEVSRRSSREVGEVATVRSWIFGFGVGWSLGAAGRAGVSPVSVAAAVHVLREVERDGKQAAKSASRPPSHTHGEDPGGERSPREQRAAARWQHRAAGNGLLAGARP